MERRKDISNAKQNGEQPSGMSLTEMQLTLNHLTSRASWANKMGFQYEGKRKIYQALGYPEDKDLDFQYYNNRYRRQDIASAIIDRPVDATWKGDLSITEEGKTVEDSKLQEAWAELNKRLKVKQRLAKTDKLAGIGHYSILLFGFDDTKKPEDWKTVVTGKRKLVFLKQISEENASINTWENKTSNPRFGLPKTYKVSITNTDDGKEVSRELVVHYTRVIHVKEGSLTSEVFGRPRLMPLINRLNDLEKLLGGDAEMFWRGARPGYTAIPKENFSMGDTERTQLETELDNYEHDLRRFITAEGVDIDALKQQVANPMEHVDVQLQAISAQTGIPKRVLIGSERGELASSQDKDQWLTLIKTREEEFAEPEIFRPFIDKCIEHGILPDAEDYVVIWEDIFAPSEKDKVEVGTKRAEALKKYSDNILAGDILPPALVPKYLMGLTDDQVQEVSQAAEENIRDNIREEDRLLAEEEARLRREGTPATSNKGMKRRT